MPIEIIVPRLGWSMEEGAFVAWLKKDGEQVKAGDPIFSIEGDKAAQEIEAIDSGVLSIPPTAPKPGDPVKVGQVLGYLLGEHEKVGQAGTGRESGVRSQEPARGDQATTKTEQRSGGIRPGEAQTASKRGELAISPRARRAASELNVDWTKVQGSGRTGRIRERDIRAAAMNTGAKPALPAVRRVIAERMLNSLRTTAPVTLHTTADATKLVELRNKLKAASASGALVPSYTDMLVKLAALALQKHAALNARWEGGALVPSDSIHIGVAVDTEAGLLVPVIRNVGTLELAQITAQSSALVTRARTRQLAACELQGGTFTITSLGAFGIDAFTPIINYPEIAILGVGRIQRQPVVIGESVVPREILTLSLTFDHCALDGAPAARFLQTLCELIGQAAHLSSVT